jgi:hypothetical protein
MTLRPPRAPGAPDQHGGGEGKPVGEVPWVQITEQGRVALVENGPTGALRPGVADERIDVSIVQVLGGQRPVEDAVEAPLEASDSEVLVFVVEMLESVGDESDRDRVGSTHRHVAPPQIAQDRVRVLLVVPAAPLVLVGVEVGGELSGPTVRRKRHGHVPDDHDVVAALMMCDVAVGQATTCQHVVIEEEHDLPRGPLQPVGACDRGSATAVPEVREESRVVRRSLLQPFDRSVVAAVDHHDELVDQRIVQQRSKDGRELGPAPVGGHDDRENGSRPAVGSPHPTIIARARTGLWRPCVLRGWCRSGR